MTASGSGQILIRKRGYLINSRLQSLFGRIHLVFRIHEFVVFIMVAVASAAQQIAMVAIILAIVGHYGIHTLLPSRDDLEWTVVQELKYLMMGPIWMWLRAQLMELGASTQ